MTEWINIMIAFLALIVSFAIPFYVLRKEYKNNVRFRLFDKRVEILEKTVFISSLSDRLKKSVNLQK